MPDVRGMGLKEAVFLLESRGLRVAFTGKGAVREQTLPPGAKIQRGKPNIEIEINELYENVSTI